eukprot:Colp12_sorted_trinity150504_noHs@8765
MNKSPVENCDQDPIAITPTIEDLQIDREVKCPQNDCKRVLPSKACLRLHLVSHHRIISKDEDLLFLNSHGTNASGRQSIGKKTQPRVNFYCPDATCARAKGQGGRPFTSLALVKQHYWTLHGPREFECSLCLRKFGLRDVRDRHERDCGQAFGCTCGAGPFATRNCLRTHVRRNQCKYPDDPLWTGSSDGNLCGSEQGASQSSGSALAFNNIARDSDMDNTGMPKAAATNVRASTQTQHRTGPIRREKGVRSADSAVLIGGVHGDVITRAGNTNNSTDNVSRDSSTQTTARNRHIHPYRRNSTNRRKSDHAGTQLVTMENFSCQTVAMGIDENSTQTLTSRDFDMQALCDFGTQTAGSVDFGIQTGGLHTSTLPSVDFGIQTVQLEDFGAPSISTGEFGIQTVESDIQRSHVLLGDFGTQTNDTAMAESMRSESIQYGELGTQTMDLANFNIRGNVLENLGTQTQTVETVDYGTSCSPLSEDALGLSSFSILQSSGNFRSDFSQTQINFAEFSTQTDVETFDFGTQTVSLPQDFASQITGENNLDKENMSLSSTPLLRLSAHGRLMTESDNQLIAQRSGNVDGPLPVASQNDMTSEYRDNVGTNNLVAQDKALSRDSREAQTNTYLSRN